MEGNIMKRAKKQLPKEKLCPSCKILKQANEFNVWNGYIRWICIECERARSNEYRLAHLEQARERLRKWQRANREKINKERRERYAQKKLLAVG